MGSDPPIRESMAIWTQLILTAGRGGKARPNEPVPNPKGNTKDKAMTPPHLPGIETSREVSSKGYELSTLAISHRPGSDLPPTAHTASQYYSVHIPCLPRHTEMSDTKNTEEWYCLEDAMVHKQSPLHHPSLLHFPKHCTICHKSGNSWNSVSSHPSRQKKIECFIFIRQIR